MHETKTIKSLTVDAFGLSEGKPILIPFTLPGEEVEISEPFKKKEMRFAKPLEILKSSKDRIQPFCPHFTECGGCLTQHLAYEKEIAWKEGRIRDLFSPFNDFELFPMIQAEKFQGWRNKMEFNFSVDGQLGLYRFFGDRSIVDVRHCSLGSDWFQQAVDEIRDLVKKENIPPYNPQTNKGILRSLTLRHSFRTEDRMIFLTVHGNPDEAWSQSQIQALIELGEKFKSSLFLITQKYVHGRETKYMEKHLLGKATLEEKLTVFGKELSFEISPRAFFQPHPIQAEKLYQRAFDLLELKGEEILLDLFAGTGTLALFAAPFVKKVIAVERSEDACRDMRVNRKKNGFTNLKILQGDVGKILKKGNIPTPDVVLVDPPRAGLSPDAIDALLKLKASKIGYISCNPLSQAKDLVPLIEAGYKLKAIQPVDQFPRSPHIENIALLVR